MLTMIIETVEMCSGIGTSSLPEREATMNALRIGTADATYQQAKLSNEASRASPNDTVICLTEVEFRKRRLGVPGRV
jgi:hypothetical protein